MVTFIDTIMDQWPIILITNPKDATFFSYSDPLAMIPLSSHIRVLIFSPWSGLFVYFNRNLFTQCLPQLQWTVFFFAQHWNK